MRYFEHGADKLNFLSIFSLSKLPIEGHSCAKRPLTSFSDHLDPYDTRRAIREILNTNGTPVSALDVAMLYQNARSYRKRKRVVLCLRQNPIRVHRNHINSKANGS